MTLPTLTPMEHRILAEGRVIHSDWTNVAWDRCGGPDDQRVRLVAPS